MRCENESEVAKGELVEAGVRLACRPAGGQLTLARHDGQLHLLSRVPFASILSVSASALLLRTVSRPALHQKRTRNSNFAWRNPGAKHKSSLAIADSEMVIHAEGDPLQADGRCREAMNGEMKRNDGQRGLGSAQEREVRNSGEKGLQF